MGAIGPIVAAVVAAVGAYLAAYRRFSGRIGSSEASELWKESTSIREWSRARIEALERENEHCREMVDKLREERMHDLERIARLESRLQMFEGGEGDVPDFIS